MSLRDKDFLDAARDALAEAEASALASIGKRGTSARRAARKAVQTRLDARWRAVLARVPLPQEPVDPIELSGSFYLNPNRDGQPVDEEQ